MVGGSNPACRGIKFRRSEKQRSYVGLIAGQMVTSYESHKLGTISKGLFAAIKADFLPMLRCPVVTDAILAVCTPYPEIRELIEQWVREAGARGTS